MVLYRDILKQQHFYLYSLPNSTNIVYVPLFLHKVAIQDYAKRGYETFDNHYCFQNYMKHKLLDN